MSSVLLVDGTGLTSTLDSVTDFNKVLRWCGCRLQTSRCQNSAHNRWYRVQNIKTNFGSALDECYNPNVRVTEWDIPHVGKMRVPWDVRSVTIWNDAGDDVEDVSMEYLTNLAGDCLTFTATLRCTGLHTYTSKSILITGVELSTGREYSAPHEEGSAGEFDDSDESAMEEEHADKWEICRQNNIPYRGSGYDSEC